jgi:tellurite resistance protein
MTNVNIFPGRPNVPASLIKEEQLAFQSSDFMEAVVAAYALVAHADGDVSPSERRRLMLIARTEPRLSAFSRNEIAEEFAIHEANYELDVEVATEIAYEKVELMNGRAEEARAVIDACRLAIVADGTLHPSEFSMLQRIRDLLGMASED